jgi:hypothetical protein
MGSKRVLRRWWRVEMYEDSNGRSDKDELSEF